MTTQFRKTGLGVLGEMAWGGPLLSFLSDARAKRGVAERVVRTTSCPVLTVRGT